MVLRKLARACLQPTDFGRRRTVFPAAEIVTAAGQLVLALVLTFFLMVAAMHFGEQEAGYTI